MTRAIARMTGWLCLVLLVAGLLAWGSAQLVPRDDDPAAGGPPDPAVPSTPSDEVDDEPGPTTVLLGGGLLWHDGTWQSAAADRATTGRPGTLDFKPMFAAVEPEVRRADLAVCQEVGPFAGPGEPNRSYPTMAGPAEAVDWIAAAGWDACVTGTSRALDDGYAGLDRTAYLLAEAGVAHVGTARSEAERRQPVVVEADGGLQVGLVSGTTAAAPAEQPWSLSSASADELATQARRAREAGAEVVIAFVDTGEDFDSTPAAAQTALAEDLARSGEVDVVVGTGSRVVQPVTKVDDTWVVHGLGSMMSQYGAQLPRTYEGVLLELTITEDDAGAASVDGATYLPLVWNQWSPGDPVRVRWVTKALDEGNGDRIRLQEARTALRSAIGSLGGGDGLLER